jgi:hypothetical protein
LKIFSCSYEHLVEGEVSCDVIFVSVGVKIVAVDLPVLSKKALVLLGFGVMVQDEFVASFNVVCKKN